MVYSAMLVVCSMGSCGLEPITSTNACGHVCRYMDQKGLAAMLTSIQSSGVTPEVRPEEYAGKNVCK